ncbi:MAG: DUF362 domain-containing protein [Desulfobacterales bacterium]|nr:DUF362 domain-containing protein [Desulfobacterales bacterium]
MRLVAIDFSSYHESVGAALNMIGAKETLAKQTSILLKPNLVNSSPHPVTTPAECCEAVVEYVRSCSKADVVIAEGAGHPSLETEEIFDLLGYGDLSIRRGVTLVDLNRSPIKRLENKNCSFFPEIYLPEIAFTHFIISLPVLKAHTLSVITGTLKNMIGFAPPKHYSGRFGGWKKAVFHGNIHQAIVDLNRYRSPDLSIMDATVGLAESHLGGRRCTPGAGKIVAGFSPLEVDRKAATLLGFDWKRIPHLVTEI